MYLLEGIGLIFPLKEAHFYLCSLRVRATRCASRGHMSTGTRVSWKNRFSSRDASEKVVNKPLLNRSERPRDAHVGLHHPQGKRGEEQKMLRHQRSRANGAFEPDHETDPDGRRNHPLVRWREYFRQQHGEEKLRFCPSKPEPLFQRRRVQERSRWRFSLPTAQAWTYIRRRSKSVC